jgi:hypothetical protein
MPGDRLEKGRDSTTPQHLPLFIQLDKLDKDEEKESPVCWKEQARYA